MNRLLPPPRWWLLSVCLYNTPKCSLCTLTPVLTNEHLLGAHRILHALWDDTGGLWEPKAPLLPLPTPHCHSLSGTPLHELGTATLVPDGTQTWLKAGCSAGQHPPLGLASSSPQGR